MKNDPNGEIVFLDFPISLACVRMIVEMLQRNRGLQELALFGEGIWQLLLSLSFVILFLQKVTALTTTEQQYSLRP